ncbi:MAG: NADH-quinone oxidoreductase subunit A [Planctomycetota bacterium]|jgi:NADH-quinone oxidoreductase subunit A|nr:NADH-quinone oxidoreductase subunit A [Planctomycetota bacterium]
MPPVSLPPDASLASYLPVAMIAMMAIVFVIANIVLSTVLGPRAEGAIKGTTYEAGMDPIGTTRKRFNVRFYMMAVTFLLFDVEIIFLYPWAVSYSQLDPGSPEAKLYLGRILFFLATSVVAYIYAWKKGVFKWD